MEIIKIPKKEGIIDRTTGKVLNRKLRVAAYARVSTMGAEQLNSYESQKKYYYEKINNNPEWQYVDIYADEGISGTTDYRRASFMKMIQDALSGKIDLILTKSISRFGRNTMDVLKNVRLLRDNNVAVLFEENNLNTLDTKTSEMLLTTLSAVAQQESENISEHVKLGLQMKMNRGELIGFNRCYGYRNENDKLVIVDEEAEVVKFIFDKYCDGHGANGIAKMLTEQGIKSPKGNNKWNDSTIRGILRNEKYKGDVLQGKTYTADPLSHKRYKNLGEADQFYVSEHHEPIISPEKFDMVQEILKERCGARANGRRIGNVGRKFAFSSRIRCGFCGNCYTRRMVTGKGNTKIPAWSCTSFSKTGKENCSNSKTIREEMIKEAFVDSYKLLCSNIKFEKEKFLSDIEKTINKKDKQNEIEKLNKEFSEIKTKKSRLVDLMVDGKIAEYDYNDKIEKYNKKLEVIQNRLEQLKLLVEDRESISEGLEKVKELLDEKDIMEEFDQEIFNAIVDYVIVGGYDEKGNIDQYLIRFVLKREFDLSLPKEIPEEFIIQNNKIDLSSNNVIIDFINTRQYFSYERDEKGKLNKVLRNGLRIRVEYDIT